MIHSIKFLIIVFMPNRGIYVIFFSAFIGRLYDKIVITHNNEVLGAFNDIKDSYKAFALQYGALYLYGNFFSL